MTEKCSLKRLPHPFLPVGTSQWSLSKAPDCNQQHGGASSAATAQQAPSHTPSASCVGRAPQAGLGQAAGKESLIIIPSYLSCHLPLPQGAVYTSG